MSHVPHELAEEFPQFAERIHALKQENAAIEAAFCSAERVTLVGSMTPIASRSPYSPVCAL